MKYFLLLSLITVQAHAGFWCHEKPNEIREPRPNAGCFKVPEDFDVETAAVANGALVVDAAKLAAKNVRLAAEQAARDARLAKIATCETLYQTVDSLSSLAEQKAILKCLVKDAR